MGAFFGSIQVRGHDRSMVLAAVSEISRKTKSRFLIGPALGGWIGVYPENNGQDPRLAADLARRLPGELILALVHDDDVFAYDYYRDGRLLDQYNSRPDYFGKVSEHDRRKLHGRPEVIEHLAVSSQAFAALRGTLADADSIVFASELLDAFAAALGMQNALCAYEYLRRGETDEIEDWDAFVHIPDLSAEVARQGRAEAVLAGEKQRLTEQGLFLAECGGQKGRLAAAPWWCPAPDGHGFLVGWSNHAAPTEEPQPLERYGPPWSAGATVTRWTIGTRLFGLELSPSGRFLAVARAAGDWKAVLWDLNERRRMCEASQVRAVTWVGFLPDESAMLSVSSHGDEGQVVISPIDGGTPRAIAVRQARVAAVHPGGARVAVADHRSRLAVIDLAAGRVERTLFLGGRQNLPKEVRAMAEQARAQMRHFDFDAMEQALRQQQEAMLRQLGRRALPAEFGSVDELRARLEKEFADRLREMREQQIRMASPEWQAEQELGAEGAFRLAFDPSGELLFAATTGGARVYSWPEVIAAEESTPRPVLKVDVVDGSMESTPHGLMRREGYVYDLEYDPERRWLLCAGLEGRVRYLDLASGRSGVLLEPPGRPSIARCGLARDRTALALTCDAARHAEGKDRRGPCIQFWNYQALCDRV